MSYDMTKFSYDDWRDRIRVAKYNQRKILFHPFYNKRKFVNDVYKIHFGVDLDFDHLVTFDEKLNGYKIDNALMKRWSKYANKYLVREYVKEKIGSQYLIPTYFCKSKITREDLEKLPNGFVLKTTLGSGTNFIVKDKNTADLDEICRYMNYLLKLKYGYLHGEFMYNYGKNKIIAEQLLLDDHGNIPDDLKAFCFQDNNGNKKKILYVERVIGDERARIMFDEKWQPVHYDSNFEKLDEVIPKPKNLKKILEIMDKLSEDFNFVRVDLFLIGNHIYFGELTFIPTAGFLKFKNEQDNIEWGNYIGNHLTS